MKLRSLGWIIAAAGAAVASISVSTAGCTNEQAKIRCQAVPDVQSWANYVGQYKANGDPTGSCENVAMPKGESLFLFTFSPDPGKKLNKQGIKAGPLGEGIAAASLPGSAEDGGAVLGTTASIDLHHAAVAVGEYTTENPDTNGICVAPAFSIAQATVPAYLPQPEEGEGEGEGTTDGGDGGAEEDAGAGGDEAGAGGDEAGAGDGGTEDASAGGGDEAGAGSEDASAGGDDGGAGSEEAGSEESSQVPEQTRSYAWSNFRVYVTPNQIGMQFEADLVLTVDTCTQKYHVQAIEPEIDCGKVDADGNPVTNADGVQESDESICTNPDSLADRVADPNLALSCADLSSDPTSPTWRCVPAKPFPSNR